MINPLVIPDHRLSEAGALIINAPTTPPGGIGAGGVLVEVDGLLAALEEAAEPHGEEEVRGRVRPRRLRRGSRD